MAVLKLRNLSLLQIELIAGLSRVSSLRELAREFRLDPAAVSRSFRSVEKAIGSELFDRSQRGIRLNARGVEVSKHCRAILASALQIEEMPKSVVDRGSQIVVTIGSRGFLNVELAAALLNQQTTKLGWRWRLVDGSPVDVLRGCVSGVIDASLHLEDWTWPAGWVSKCECTMTWGLVGRSGHPLSAKTSLDQVRQYPFAVAAYLNQDRIERASDIFPLKWSERILGHEAQTAATIREIILHSDQLAYMPLITIEEELTSKQLKLFSIAEVQPVVMTIRLSVHQDRVPQKAFSLLKRALADIGKKDQRLAQLAGLKTGDTEAESLGAIRVSV